MADNLNTDQDSLNNINELRQKGISLQEISAALAAKLTYETRTYTDELKLLSGIKSKVSENDRAILDLSRKIAYSAQENNTILRRTGSLVKELAKNEQYLANTDREIGIILGKNKDIRNEILEQAGKLRVVYDNLQEVESEIQRLSLKAATSQGNLKNTYLEQVKIRRQQLTSLQLEKQQLEKNVTGEAKRIALLQSSKKTLKELIETRKEEVQFGYDVNKVLGSTGAIIDNISKVGNKALAGFDLNLGVFNESVEKAKDKMYEVAEAFVRVDDLAQRQSDIQKDILNQYKGYSNAVEAVAGQYVEVNRQVDVLANNIKTSLTGLDISKIFDPNATKSQLASYTALLQNFGSQQVREFALTYTEVKDIIEEYDRLIQTGKPISTELLESYEQVRKNLALQSVEAERYALIQEKINRLQEAYPQPDLKIQKQINDLLDEQEDIQTRAIKVAQTISRDSIDDLIIQGDKLKVLDDQRNSLQSINGQVFNTAKALASTTKYGEQFQKLLDEENNLLEHQYNLQVELNNLESLGNVITKEQETRKLEINKLLGEASKKLEDNLTQQEKISKSIIDSSTGLSLYDQRLRTLRAGLSEIKNNIKDALVDPLTTAIAKISLGSMLFAKLKEAFLALDKAATDFTRLNGTLATNNILLEDFNTKMVSTTDVLKLAGELTRQLGVNVGIAFSQDVLNSAAELQNTMGLTVQEAGNLALITQATKGNIDENVESVVKGVNEFNKMNKSAISHGLIMKDVANVSSDVAASLGSNPEKLAKAAASARRLGLELKTLDSIANSLLDFESSIEAELEAQLLTGKNINLAKARELALNNDLEGLGKELFNNSASLLEFGRMNRLEQESYAKAMGMTREQLAKVAYLRGIESNMTQEQLQAVTGMTAEELKRMEVTESINKSIEKISQALATPLALMAGLLESSAALYGILVLIGAFSVVKLVGSVVSLAVSLGLAATSAATLAATLTLGLAAIGIVAAIVAITNANRKAQKDMTANMPKAAKGALVPATPGGTPVIVGEGGEDEYIVPKSKMKGIKSLPSEITEDKRLQSELKLEQKIEPVARPIATPEQTTTTITPPPASPIIQVKEGSNVEQGDMLKQLIETNDKQLKYIEQLTTTMKTPTVVKLDSTQVGMTMRQGFTTLG